MVVRERLDQPEDAHHQEEETEDVGVTPANVFSGRISEIAPAIRKRTPKIHSIHRVAPAVSEPKTRFSDPRGKEHDPDEHPDGGDRGLVELEDHQRAREPEDAGGEPDPPQICDLAEWIGHLRADCDCHE